MFRVREHTASSGQLRAVSHCMSSTGSCHIATRVYGSNQMKPAQEMYCHCLGRRMKAFVPLIQAIPRNGVYNSKICLHRSRNWNRGQVRMMCSGQYVRLKDAVDSSRVGGNGVEGEEMVKVRHIQVESEEMVDVLKKQLDNGEYSFEELAKMVSQCESKVRGGNLGWIRRGMMVRGFEDLVFGMDLDSTEKIKTEFGWHLVKIEGKAIGGSEMSVKELNERKNEIGKNLVVVDVREKSEVEEVNFKDIETVWLPMGEYGRWADDFEKGKVGLNDTQQEIVVMCHHGIRSKEFCKFLGQAGYRNVRNLTGGIHQWAKEIDSSVGFY